MNIVEEIRSDPERGAKRLDAEFRVGLTTLALRFCHDASDAEDLVNRTFAEACRSIDRYAEQSAFFAWISKIMTNIHANDVRRKSRQNEVLDGERHESEPDPDAEAAIYRDVDASILRDAIDRLPPDERNAVVMHYFLDIPVREAARILSVPSGTFAWRLHNARMILAAKLGAFVKKPGAKAILLSLAAALLLAATAAVVAVVAESSPGRAASPLAAVESAVESSLGRARSPSAPQSTGETPVAPVSAVESSPGRVRSPSAPQSMADTPVVAESTIESFSLTSTGETQMPVKNIAASAAFATMFLMPARVSSAGASSAEATFETFNSAYGNSGGFAPEAFLSRYSTSDDSNAISSFSSHKPRGFAINIL